MGNIHVVDVRRGYTWCVVGHTEACRGTQVAMSWEYVVEHMLFHVHVLGTDVVCRGY